MSIIKDGNAPKQNAPKEAQPQAGGQQTMAENFGRSQQAAPAQQQQPISLRTFGIGRQVMGRTQAGEILSKLKKSLDEVYAESAGDKSFYIETIPVDMMQTATLGVSALIVALQDKLSPDGAVAYHTLIIEASAEAPLPKIEHIGGQQVQVRRTIGEAYDDVMMNTMADFVARAFPGAKQYPVSAEVVPRDFNMEDKTAIWNLASNAIFAANQELEVQDSGFIDLNLGHLDNDSNINLRTSFNNPHIVNAVGHPVRADIKMEMSLGTTQQNQNQQGMERTNALASVQGFIDLIWCPKQQPQQGFYGQQQPMAAMNNPLYVPRFIITAMESAKALTIASQLLAFVPVLSLRDNNQWMQTFRRQSFNGERDLNDIGAVGIEANFMQDPSGYGAPIDTSADSFTTEQLYRLCNAVFNDGLSIAIDIPECGPDTWFNEVFMIAGQNNAGANQAIIEAANVLTNGAFSRYFPANGRVCDDECNRIHMGYYVDGNGVRRDIRDISYLAVMNTQGKTDPTIIRAFSDTFANINEPLNMRLATRERIITGIVPSVVFTGFARRVTIDPEFIRAFAQALADVHLSITQTTQYADGGNYMRASAQFAAASMLTGATQSVFNRGRFGYQQPVGGAAAMNRRW